MEKPLTPKTPEPIDNPKVDVLWVPNDPADPRFWAFWHEVRELTCPD